MAASTTARTVRYGTRCDPRAVPGAGPGEILLDDPVRGLSYAWHVGPADEFGEAASLLVATARDGSDAGTVKVYRTDPALAAAAHARPLAWLDEHSGTCLGYRAGKQAGQGPDPRWSGRPRTSRSAGSRRRWPPGPACGWAR